MDSCYEEQSYQFNNQTHKALKKIAVSLMAFMMLFAIGTVDAQKMNKDEKKKWKKMAKEYKKNPEALKNLQNQVADLKSVNQNLESQVGDLQNELDSKDRRITELEKQYFQALADLEQANNNVEEYTDPQSDPNALPMGIIFRVQIGAYAENQVPGALDTTDDLNLEQNANVQKIVLGQFRNYAEAEELKTRLVKMGVKDAWIVSYRDGQRITIEEATSSGQ